MKPQKKVIIPIEIELYYSDQAEKTAKIKVVKELIDLIAKSDEKTRDMKRMNKIMRIFKGKDKSKTYLAIQSVSIVMSLLLFLKLLYGITIHDYTLVVDRYIGGTYAYGYYIDPESKKDISKGKMDIERNFQYGKLKVENCDQYTCSTNKGKINKRFFDYYSVR